MTPMSKDRLEYIRQLPWEHEKYPLEACLAITDCLNEIDLLTAQLAEQRKEIEELRKQVEGKWISVADRLPEPPCIINMKQSNRLLFLLIKEVKEWCGEFERKHLVSTHWQPLPQSPQPPK